MNRKLMVILAGLVTALLCGDGFAQPEPTAPNVLFILVDDLGYMDIGANNPETFYETPHIDRLASTGIRFTQGYAANPVCSPTRYSLLTGRHPSRIDATNFFCGRRSGRFNPAPLNCRMPLEEFTLAEAMQEAGYATFFAGKWHLGDAPEFWPTQQGFDVNRGGHAAGGPYKGGKYFSPYNNPRLENGPTGEHLPDRLTSETIQFIEQHRDEPFFAYLAFYSVHTPLMAPEERVQKYRNKAQRLGLVGKTAFGQEELVGQTAGNGEAGSRPTRRVRTLQSHAVYAAMVESVDRNVGRLLDALERLELDDRTVVCLMSDNGGLSTSEGWPTSNLPLRGGKGWLYEGGIREPFLIRWPGVADDGSTRDTPVVSMDFYPTLLEITGQASRPDQHQDGVSLVSVLRDRAELKREALFWHYPHYSNQGGFPGAAIRVGDYKLIERLEDGRVQLYDLAHDLSEQRDLAAEQPDRVASMRRLLHAWYKKVDAKFLQPRDDGAMPWRPEPEPAVGKQQP